MKRPKLFVPVSILSPLDMVHKKQNMVLDELETLVCQNGAGTINALHISGRGGSGKSHLTKVFLLTHYMSPPNTPDAGWAYQRGHMPKMGFFYFCKKNRDRTIVCDDCIELVRDDTCQGYLLVMTEPGDDRYPSYPRMLPPSKMYPRGKLVEIKFHFAGKIITIANLEMGGDPVRDALADRATQAELDFTDVEMMAFLNEVAKTDPKGVPSKEANYVLGVVTELCQEADIRPTLRLFCDKALTKYKAAQKGIGTRTSWIDRLQAEIQREAEEQKRHATLSTDAKQRLQKEIALGVLRMFPERRQAADRIAEWERQTESRLGERMCKATLYNVIKRLKAEGSLDGSREYTKGSVSILEKEIGGEQENSA